MLEGTILAALLALLSAACFGFVPHIQNKGLDTTDALTASKVNMAAVVAFGLLLTPFYLDWSMFQTRGAWIYAIIGVFFPFLSMQLQIAAIPRVGPTITSALGSFTPFFAIIPAIMLFGEVVSLSGWIGIALMTLGLLAAATRSRGVPRSFPLWALTLPLGTAVIRGFMVPALKIGQETAPNPLFAFLIMASVSTLLIFCVHVIRRETLGKPNAGWLWFAGSGGTQLLGLVFLAMALRAGDIAIVAPLSSIAPIWALLYGALIFKREVLGARHVGVAGLVVIGGILLVAR